MLSLFVYRFPSLRFAAIDVPYYKESPAQVRIVIGGILAVDLGLQRITEQRRAWWQSGFTTVIAAFAKVSARLSKTAGVIA